MEEILQLLGEKTPDILIVTWTVRGLPPYQLKQRNYGCALCHTSEGWQVLEGLINSDGTGVLQWAEYVWRTTGTALSMCITGCRLPIVFDGDRQHLVLHSCTYEQLLETMRRKQTPLL